MSSPNFCSLTSVNSPPSVWDGPGSGTEAQGQLRQAGVTAGSPVRRVSWQLDAGACRVAHDTDHSQYHLGRVPACPVFTAGHVASAGVHLLFTDEELELDPCDDPQGLGATGPKSRAVGGRLVSRQAAVASSRGGR